MSLGHSAHITEQRLSSGYSAQETEMNMVIEYGMASFHEPKGQGRDYGPRIHRWDSEGPGPCEVIDEIVCVCTL